MGKRSRDMRARWDARAGVVRDTTAIGRGRIKKLVSFYQMNHESQVEELKLLSVASGLVGVSTEDFIRGCALERAARIVIVEQRRQLKEQGQTDADPSASAPVGASELAGNTQEVGVENGVERQTETGIEAEAGTSANPAPGDGDTD